MAELRTATHRRRGCPRPLVTLKIDGQHRARCPRAPTCSRRRAPSARASATSATTPACRRRRCAASASSRSRASPSWCRAATRPSPRTWTSSPTSEKVVTARAQMLEFTLVNHPVDCPICDKAGECTLQKMYQEWDGSPSRVDTGKVHKPKVVDLGPEIVLDAERCILCTRCIRVCDEVAQGSPARDGLPRRSRAAHDRAGQAARQPLLAQHRRRLPGRRAHGEGLPLRHARLGAVHDAVGVRGLRHRLQHRGAPRARQDLSPRAAREPGRQQVLDVRRGALHLQRARHRSASPAPRIGGETDVDGQGARLRRRAARRACRRAARRRRAQRAGDQRGQLRSSPRWPRRSASTHVYLAGRPPRPERADDILRSADVNPNTAGARILGRRARPRARSSSTPTSSPARCTALWILGDHVALDDEALAALGKLDVSSTSRRTTTSCRTRRRCCCRRRRGPRSTAPSPTSRAWCSASAPPSSRRARRARTTS